MGTLIHEAKRNSQHFTNTVNEMILLAHKARASKIIITWFDNVIYCTLSGKKQSLQVQYSEITRNVFNKILDVLKEHGYNVDSTETLELNAVRFVLRKSKKTRVA